MIPTLYHEHQDAPFFHQTFRSWQRDCLSHRLLPVIGFSGTRGKSTVLRLVEAVAQQMHLRSASWTDLGVEIQTRRQRGELSGWSHALTRLSEGSIDVAFQELDWAMVNAVGLPQASYPAMVLSGIRELMPHNIESRQLNFAIKNARRCLEAVTPSGVIVANADDYYVWDVTQDVMASVIMVSQSWQSPTLRRHFQDGGSGVWVRNGYIWVGDPSASRRVGRLSDFPVTFGGKASFNITNLLLAIGLAHALGLDLPMIRAAMSSFHATWDILPASMNVFPFNDSVAVIDQLGPDWVLKDVLRAINPERHARQVTVIGDLGWIDQEDAFAVGRLLGRYHGAIVLHGDQPHDHLEEFRRGLSANPYPPLLIMLPTERRAINRAFNTLKTGDVLLILTNHDSAPAFRAVQRQLRVQPTHPNGEDA